MDLFTGTLRAEQDWQHVTNKVRVTNIDVRNQVANCVSNWWVTLQQMKIDNVFTAWYATNKVLVNNLEVSNQLANSV